MKFFLGQIREENIRGGEEFFFSSLAPPKENLKWRPCVRLRNNDLLKKNKFELHQILN